MSTAPLNILYLHSHDTGRYIQPYGHPVKTPNLQTLAEDGVMFRQALCVNPTCSPSRASLLTGSYPHQNGMIGLTHRGSKLHEPRQHLSHVLRDAGYTTALCGIQHESADVTQLGYDIVHPRTSTDEATVDNATKVIREAGDKPFFLAVGFYATHRTPRTPQGVQWHNGHDSPTGDPRHIRPPALLPDTPETRQDFADFAVAARRLDQYMGAVLDALDQANLRERTLVICTTDHGPAFPGMKCNLTDHGLGVMLILRGPGGFTGGTVVDAMVSHLDVCPTLYDLLDLKPAPWHQGKSLLPLIRGDADHLHDAIFASVNYHSAYEPMRAVRTDRYKYIRRYVPRSGPVFANTDDGVSKNLWIQRGWTDRPPAMEQLYDLTFDPTEVNNLVVGDRAPQVLADMRQRLDQWMQDTNDPLRQGHVDPYPDQIITDADAGGPSGTRLPPDWHPRELVHS